MHYIVGYAQLKYSSDRQICTITFVTRVNQEVGDHQIKYTFGDREQDSNTFTVTSAQKYPEGFHLSARVIKDGQDFAKLELEDEYFLWDNVPVNQPSQYENGQKGAIVEMFGWFSFIINTLKELSQLRREWASVLLKPMTVLP